jgi:hypothetical protein
MKKNSNMVMQMDFSNAADLRNSDLTVKDTCYVSGHKISPLMVI